MQITVVIDIQPEGIWGRSGNAIVAAAVAKSLGRELENLVLYDDSGADLAKIHNVRLVS